MQQVLDPRTLGRPVHLLPDFAQCFGSDLSDYLRLGPNRRYGTRLEVGAVAMTHAPSPSQSGQRWKVSGSSIGRIGLQLDRALVLRLLHCRYGLGDRPETNTAEAPTTTSEDRLAQRLCAQLATVLAGRIREGLQPAGTEPAEDAGTESSWRAESATPVGPWTLQAQVVEPTSGLQSTLWFSLDEGWMDVLLTRLAEQRPALRDTSPKPTEPLASRLRVRLVAQLLQRRISLGQIMDLQVGDTIPVNLQAQSAEVRIKNSRLFTATVAEHKGKLWLTAFNDIK